MTSSKSAPTLSGNALKVVAAVSMVIDHVGMLIFPHDDILRIIGRIAFPIFSYMICEGCRHTRNRLRYLLQILILGIATTAIYVIGMDELYFNSLITFSCSIILILLLTKASESKKRTVKIFSLILFAAAVALFYLFTLKFTVDYGFWGILLPVFPVACELLKIGSTGKMLVTSPKFAAFAVGLLIMSFDIGWLQIYSLLALIPLALYNGERGFNLPKYSFYVFYPLHVGIIYLISMIV